MARRNVLVTRTFSKAFCLASVRCGYIVAHPTTVEELRYLYNPKSVNQFAQVACHRALQEFATYYAPYISLINNSRSAFIEQLKAQKVDVCSGGAGNFVCIRVPQHVKPAQLVATLESDQIYIRDVSGRFPGFVRVTIGLDMDRVANAIIAAYENLK